MGRGLKAAESGKRTPMPVANGVLYGTDLRLVLSHCIQMRKSDLTAKQLFSVPCPTCGVAPGEPCLLHSGAPRSEAHVDRKFSATEAAERKAIEGTDGN